MVYLQVRPIQNNYGILNKESFAPYTKRSYSAGMVFVKNLVEGFVRYLSID